MSGFGRRISVDARDRAFLMQPIVAFLAVKAPSQKAWAIGGKSLDQQQTSSCVGHAWRNFIRCAPLQSERGAKAFDIYREAVKLDPWADNDHEANLKDFDPGMQGGTSIRAGAKALVSFGHLKSYIWTFDVQTLANWVLTQGPVVVGTNWYDSMDHPNRHGVATIEHRAKILGGHAYLIRGANNNNEMFLCENSWGDDWGSEGRFYLTYSDMARLLAEDGEACAAVEEFVKPQR